MECDGRSAWWCEHFKVDLLWLIGEVFFDDFVGLVIVTVAQQCRRLLLHEVRVNVFEPERLDCCGRFDGGGGGKGKQVQVKRHDILWWRWHFLSRANHPPVVCR